jgi:hypothetical protein
VRVLAFEWYSVASPPLNPGKCAHLSANSNQFAQLERSAADPNRGSTPGVQVGRGRNAKAEARELIALGLLNIVGNGKDDVRIIHVGFGDGEIQR